MRRVVQFKAPDSHRLLREFEENELAREIKGFYLGYLDSCPDFTPKADDEVAENADGIGVVLTHENHEYAVKIPGPDGKTKFKLIRKTGLGLSVSGLLKYVAADSFDSKAAMMAMNVAKSNAGKVETIWASQRQKPPEERVSHETIQRMFPTTAAAVTTQWRGTSAFGTKCHKLCEDWYRGVITDFTDPRMTESEVSHEMKMFRKFVERSTFPGMDDRPFARDKLFMTEASMAFLPLLITGQCDLVLKIKEENGITWVRLLDYKFTRNMDQRKEPDPNFKERFPDYKLTKTSYYYVQLNLYKAMLEYFYPNVRVRDMYIINIDPSFCEVSVGKKHHEPQIIHVPQYPEIVLYILRRRQRQLMEHIESRSNYLKEESPAKRAKTTEPSGADETKLVSQAMSRDAWERAGEPLGVGASVGVSAGASGQREGSSSATSSASSTRRLGAKLSVAEDVRRIVTGHLPTL